MARRLLWLLLGVLAGVFLARQRRRSEADEAGPDPAEELRRKLDERRQDEAGVGEARPLGEAVDARRAEVHERARSALDDMRRAGGGASGPE